MGYLLWGQNDFRIAGMLYNSKRKMKFTIVKYPAGINGQSIVGNGTINSHNLGFKIMLEKSNKIQIFFTFFFGNKTYLGL